MRMTDTPCDAALTHSKQELARQLVEANARIEALEAALRCSNCGDPIGEVFCGMCREMGCTMPQLDKDDKDAGIGCGKSVIEPWSAALDKDIVQRLREPVDPDHPNLWIVDKNRLEAADRIEQLEAALRFMLVDPPSILNEPDTDAEVIIHYRKVARAALE